MTLQSHLPFAEPEFLFEAVATMPLPCGNRVATPDNLVKVKLEAPKKSPKPRREMTPDETEAVRCLKTVRTPPACWDKRFIRDVGHGGQITEKEAPQVWRLLHKYRRQISCPAKERLLEMALQLSAPDLRKK